MEVNDTDGYESIPSVAEDLRDYLHRKQRTRKQQMMEHKSKQTPRVVLAVPAVVKKQKFLSYLYPKFSKQRILVGTTKEVEVVFVNSLNLFTCRLIENLPMFHQLMAGLSVHADTIDEEDWVPTKNVACIVKCSVDGRWYRGRIINAYKTEYEVHFLDVGKIERVPRSFVKPMDPQFLLKPPQANFCTLNGVTGDAWTSDEKIYFENVTKNKRLTAIFTKIKRDVAGPPKYPTILMEHRSDGPPIVINELFKSFQLQNTVTRRNVVVSYPKISTPGSDSFGWQNIPGNIFHKQNQQSSVKKNLNMNCTASVMSNVSNRSTGPSNLVAPGVMSPKRPQLSMVIEPRTPDKVVKPVSSPDSSPIVLCQISKEDKKRSVECITLSDSESESNEEPLNRVKKLCTDINMDNIDKERVSSVSSESELGIAPIENEDAARLSVNQEPKLNGYNFLKFPGLRGATLYFETNEGHFYRDMRCVDSQFFWLRESAEKDDRPNEAMGCQVKPGARHHHQVVPRELVELAMLRWACILRVLQNANETVLESVEFIFGSWPHELPFAMSRFYAKFSDTLKRYRKEFSEGNVLIRNFLNRHGEDQLASFRQLILKPQPYWLFPFPVGPQGDSPQVQTRDEPKTIPPCIVLLTPMKTRNIRFAERLVEHLEKIGRRNNKDIYALPLTKSTLPKATTFDRFFFDENNVRIEGFVPSKQKAHKTILFVGDTGSGKTSLINEMINYVLGVEWEDPFRFQLVENQVSSDPKIYNKTGRIAIYKIQHMEGFRIPYSLTIVDTPGYDKNKSDSDVSIMEMIRQLFEDKNGILELDKVAVVSRNWLPQTTSTQTYVYDLVLSNLGKDLLENIIFLFTFATDREPFILKTIAASGLSCLKFSKAKHPLYFKFNSSDCFGRNQDDHISESHWWMGLTNFEGLFANLSKTATKSVSLSKQVLEERKLLEARVDNLQPFVKNGLKQLEDLKQARRFLSACQVRLETIQNTDKNGRIVREEELPPGQFATNCHRCNVTCFLSSQKETTLQCAYCPQKCSWNVHSTGSKFKWCEYVIPTSSSNDKEKYFSELKNRQTAKDELERLQQEFGHIRSALLELKNAASRSILRLEEIALVSDPFWMRPSSINLMIKYEQKEKLPGFEEQVKRLEQRRLKSVAISKIKKEETLFSLDD